MTDQSAINGYQIVFGDSEHSFSEIPQLSVDVHIKLPDVEEDEEDEELPPKPTCPPAEWGKKKRKRKSR